jgi:multidrug efflux system outer membrane protein
MKASAVFIAAILLAGCTVGPNYRRPKINVPQDYRNQPAGPTAGTEELSLGDEKWWSVFGDPALQQLIRQAVSQNFDARIAASRILQAQAQLGITRADQFPDLSAGPGFTGQKTPGLSLNTLQFQALLSWDPDFWGKFRRATEAARANVLAAEWNRREVLSALVMNVAGAYFQLRELDMELEIAKRTLASRRESLQLTTTLANGGAAGLLDVRQAEQLVETAAAAIPDTERQIGQQEDLLSTLIGDNPHDIPRGAAFTGQPVPQAVPTGLPSRLLERRPDIQAAEQQLIAANAQIGVARAALFPDLPLTIGAGIESGGLAGLFKTAGIGYNITASLTQQIFNAGRLKSNVRLTEAQEEQALLMYQQAIQQAFRQVADALISLRKYREFRERQEALTAAARDASRLSEMRYRGGAASYLEVLTNETNYFSAELNLSRARLNERLSLVQLYNALGGGWEQ